MSIAYWIQTIIEILIIAVIILGFIYEPAIAKWERRQGEKMLRALKKIKGYRK